MSTARYRNSTKYDEFVRHAFNGDLILREINNRIIKYGYYSDSERSALSGILNSNLFLTLFEIPFKYKLTQINSECKNEGKCGDRVEAYIYWLHYNYGSKYVENYVENQIIKITNKLNNATRQNVI